MSHLETVYLANVVLYINKLKSIVNLKMVNKKSEDATRMVRYFNSSIFNWKEMDKIKAIGLNEIFPNIETIEWSGSLGEIKNLNSPKLKQIVAKELSTSHYYVENELREKVIEGNYSFSYSSDRIQLECFPNLRKLTIIFENETKEENKKIIECGEKINAHLKKISKVILKTSCSDYGTLKRFTELVNDPIIILIRQTNLDPESFNKLKSLGKIKVNQFVRGIDVEDCVVERDKIYLTENLDLEAINKKYLVYSCTVRGIVKKVIDLRKFDYLNEIFGSFDKAEPGLVGIDGLTNLKKISNVDFFDYLPSSVTFLSLTPTHHYQFLFQREQERHGQHYNCFKNILECKVSAYDLNYGCYGLLSNFISCKKLDMHSGCCLNGFDFPYNLTELKILIRYKRVQFYKFTQLHYLKKLTFEFDDVRWNVGTGIDIVPLKRLFNNSKELQYLSMNCLIDGIEIPTFVTYINLSLMKSVDFSNYASLKKIELRKSEAARRNEIIEVILPTKLDSLTMSNELYLKNRYDIEVNGKKFEKPKEEDVNTILFRYLYLMDRYY